jgi:hypothetical protein
MGRIELDDDVIPVAHRFLKAPLLGPRAIDLLVLCPSPAPAQSQTI